MKEKDTVPLPPQTRKEKGQDLFELGGGGGERPRLNHLQKKRKDFAQVFAARRGSHLSKNKRRKLALRSRWRRKGKRKKRNEFFASKRGLMLGSLSLQAKRIRCKKRKKKEGGKNPQFKYRGRKRYAFTDDRGEEKKK